MGPSAPTYDCGLTIGDCGLEERGSALLQSTIVNPQSSIDMASFPSGRGADLAPNPGPAVILRFKSPPDPAIEAGIDGLLGEGLHRGRRVPPAVGLLQAAARRLTLSRT